MADKRHLPRIPQRIGVILGDDLRGFTQDVSPGGFCVELPRSLPKGAQLHGTLGIGLEKFPFTGTVAWTKAGDPTRLQRAQVGVQLTSVGNDFFVRLAALLAGSK